VANTRLTARSRRLVGRNERSCGLSRGLNHFAAAFEDHTFIYAQTWGGDVASEDGWTMNFYPVFGSNATHHFTAYNDGTGFDVGVYSGAFRYNKCVGSEDFSAKNSSDSNGSLKTKLSLKFAAVVYDAGYGMMIGWNRKGARFGHAL